MGRICDHRTMATQRPTLGVGALSFDLVLRHARGMFRAGHRRIALAALVIFVPPPVLATFVERALVVLEHEPGALLGMGVLVSIGVAATLRLLGPVVYAGYIDAAVGEGYFRGHQPGASEVLRSLPWLRLFIADLLVVAGTVLLAAAFVIPGIAFYLLFGLVGPVLVHERRGLVASFARTMRISLTALPAIAVLVLVPTLVELALHEAVFRALEGAELAVVVLVEWLLAALIGGSVGVVEVALASELMARNPEPTDARALP